MLLLTEFIKFTPPLIAIFAVLVLASVWPRLSAVFLFLESTLITLNLVDSDSMVSDFFAASVLLSFFTMVAIGTTLYFDISYQKPPGKIPNINIIIGAISILIFWFSKDKFSFNEPTKLTQTQWILEGDGISIIIAGFSLFAILVSTLTILDIQIPKSGDSRNES